MRACVMLDAADNVAVTLRQLAKGTLVEVQVPVSGDVPASTHPVLRIKLRDDLPFGHKFSLTDIKKGEPVIKYGCAIGCATEDIPEGAHVHTHNLESVRGRGR